MTAKSVLLRPLGLRSMARAPTCPLATPLDLPLTLDVFYGQPLMV